MNPTSYHKQKLFQMNCKAKCEKLRNKNFRKKHRRIDLWNRQRIFNKKKPTKIDILDFIKITIIQFHQNLLRE